MTGKERAEMIKQAITSLFRVTNLLVFNRDAGFQAEMRENQMAYGILLDSRSLMDMTGDAITRIVDGIKCSLHKSSMVRNSSSLNFNSIIYFEKLTLMYVSHAITCNIFFPSSLQLETLNLPSH